MMPDLLSALQALLGEAHVLTDAQTLAPHLTEWRGLFKGQALAVVKPSTQQEVAGVVRLAIAHDVCLVPQGGNTGLVGGQIPMGEKPCLVLSLQRLSRIREIDPLSDTMIVEAGVTLAQVQEAADQANRLFPLSLASEGSCTIGGNLATNAGGVHVLAYGSMRDLTLGLEVVLADGRIWNGLSKLRKDNAGYDLKHLFIGSEGTLGIITAASLKLFPKLKSTATAWMGVASPADAVALLGYFKDMAGPALKAFELMPRLGVEFALKHLPQARAPLQNLSLWNVLIELASPSDENLNALLENMVNKGLSDGLVEDAVMASSLDQRAQLWRLREGLSEVQRHEGGSIKHDISVPVAAIPAFLEEATAAVLRLIPDARPVPFGHLGDGNLHFNISQPVGADKQAFLSRWDEMTEVVHRIVLDYEGSIAAEHGVGRLKQGALVKAKGPVALDVMQRIKQALDPEGKLNPGAVLPSHS